MICRNAGGEAHGGEPIRLPAAERAPATLDRARPGVQSAAVAIAFGAGEANFLSFTEVEVFDSCRQ